MLIKLRKQKLITIEGKTWAVCDAAGLREAGRFEGNYLHLDRVKDEPTLLAAGLFVRAIVLRLTILVVGL
jgi:hypothetical protein